MNKPDLIIFDLGRVLVDYDFKKVVRALKGFSTLSEKEIRHYFLTTPLWDAFERGGVTPDLFFKTLQKELRLKGLTFQDFTPLWNCIFTEKPDTISILHRLRGRYRLAMLSNVNIMHWQHVVERHSFMSWFDHPIASCAVGYRKPDAEIYRLTLARAGVAPQRALFVDDIPAHITAARSLGIRAHQFVSATQLIRDLDGILG